MQNFIYFSEKMSTTFIIFSRVGVRTMYLEKIQRYIINVKRLDNSEIENFYKKHIKNEYGNMKRTLTTGFLKPLFDAFTV